MGTVSTFRLPEGGREEKVASAGSALARLSGLLLPWVSTLLLPLRSASTIAKSEVESKGGLSDSAKVRLNDVRLLASISSP